MAFMGQGLAFRNDLNTRENFIDTAERRDSVVKLANLVSYTPKRNLAAQGFLKITSISTTENITDLNGVNLGNTIILWNDPANPNWLEQYNTIINSTLINTQKIGRPGNTADLSGITTSEYAVNIPQTTLPIAPFSSTVNGLTMNFELVSVTSLDEDYLYEIPPAPTGRFNMLYRNDKLGYGSPNTGYFFYFKQGILQNYDFTLQQQISNQVVNIDIQGVNNTDTWLYQLSAANGTLSPWVKVEDVYANAYLQTASSQKRIFSVGSGFNDVVNYNFGDGIFSAIPVGNFRAYVRSSNGLTYTIDPSEMQGISVAFSYVSRLGRIETLTVGLQLSTPVSNAQARESLPEIKLRAPTRYYTQNRMVTGEDYNILPYTLFSNVLKVKAVNRTSSGVSRYLDVIDTTGKYSSTNLFADDGVLYQEPYISTTNFSYLTKTDVEGIIYNTVFQLLAEPNLRNFYYANFINYITESLSIEWYKVTTDSNSSTGFIGSTADATPYKLGSYTSTDLKYFTAGALIKFTAPATSGGTPRYFDTNNNNNLVLAQSNMQGLVSYLWAEVISVTTDGTGTGKGVLATQFGAVTLSTVVPSGAVVNQIIPKLSVTISSSVITTMIDLIFNNKPFGLRYDATTQTWQIVFETNLNTTGGFNLGSQGDITNTQQDSSWMLLFTTDNEIYTISSRLLKYVFESNQEVTFYFDTTVKVYDTVSSNTIIDQLKVLSINTQPDNTSPFSVDLNWQIVSEYNGLDGYIDPSKIVVTFADSNNDGVVDNPQLFLDIVSPDVTPLTKYIIQQKYLISQGQEDYKYVSNDSGIVLIFATQSNVGSLNQYTDGQYFYFVDKQIVKKYNAATSALIPTLDYKVYIGRDNLKFQYIHNADYDSRIDPGASNIMDVFVLTKDYDTQFRQWLAGANISEPLAPSSSELNSLLSTDLNLVKSISDEIVYHPVDYILLFGSKADLNLQASFNVVKNSSSTASNNDIVARIITAFTEFFALENWNFGDTFYFTELSTYVLTKLSPDITSFVIVPKQGNLYFGSLFEIQCPSNKIFVSCATASDINVVAGLTSDNIKTVTGVGLNSVVSSQNITSASFGVTNG
jgi:hypothetical protein